MLDLAALAAPTWVETAGLGRRLDFGCIPLSPGDFDNHASTLFGLVAGVEGDKPAREPTAADLQHLQVIACLTVRHVRAPGGESQPFRFVLDEGAEDPSAGRFWIGRLPSLEVGQVAGVALKDYIEAATRAARFRRGPEDGAHAGRDGEAVRSESGDVAAAAG